MSSCLEVQGEDVDRDNSAGCTDVCNKKGRRVQTNTSRHTVQVSTNEAPPQNMNTAPVSASQPSSSSHSATFVGDTYYRAFMAVEKDATKGDVFVIFHTTVVVHVRKSTGKIILNTGGHRTFTTRQSIMDALKPFGVKIDPCWTTVYTPTGKIAYREGMSFVVSSSQNQDVPDQVFSCLRRLNIKESTRDAMRQANNRLQQARGQQASTATICTEPSIFPVEARARTAGSSVFAVPSTSTGVTLADEFPPLIPTHTAAATITANADSAYSSSLPPSPRKKESKEERKEPEKIYTQEPEDPDEDSLRCVMCFENFSSIVLVPCFHACLCSECSKMIMTHEGGCNPCKGMCPMCRTPIDDCIQIND